MDNINEKHQLITSRCFEELRGTFTVEQSFHITLGAATIKWIELKNKYSPCNLRIQRILSEYGSGFELLRQELAGFENRFHKFDGVLTGIMNKIFIYKDKSATEKLKIIFQIIDGSRFSSADEVRGFINKLVTIGTLQSGFNDTPESINKILAGLINLGRVRSIANYCSGTSGIAIEIFDCFKDMEINEDIFYYAEEINATNYLIARLLMIVNEINHYEIVNKDALVYTDNDEKLRFDFVVSDMPQIMGFDKHLSKNDPRFRYGVPTRSSADWAFGQNVIYHINETGKGVIIGTKGTLVRGNEVDIRKGIINDDLIECVITLPENLYEKSSIGTEMIIFNKRKPSDMINRILFIDASQYGYRINKNQHAISSEGINKVLEAYRYGVEEPGFSKFVDLEKVKEYDYRLNPIEYLGFDVLKNSLTDSVPLKEIAEISKGVQLSKEDMEELSKEDTHYYLNIKDIEEGRINYNDSSKLTYKKHDWLGRYDIEPNDIILTSKGWAVKVAIVEENFKPAFISGNLTRIRVNPEKYNPYVLYEFLQSEIGTSMLEGLQTGTTIKLLNNSQLERFEVPKFNMEFMNDIGQEIKRSKIEYERSIEEATRAFEEKREQLIVSLGWSISKKKKSY